ncbi:hypothetical protein MLM_3944 [Mycobacterium lepraemurium]|nr:hypothetical protein MLM_3944 [Mycobacterium lepraemurium]
MTQQDRAAAVLQFGRRRGYRPLRGVPTHRVAGDTNVDAAIGPYRRLNRARRRCRAGDGADPAAARRAAGRRGGLRAAPAHPGHPELPAAHRIPGGAAGRAGRGAAGAADPRRDGLGDRRAGLLGGGRGRAVAALGHRPGGAAGQHRGRPCCATACRPTAPRGGRPSTAISRAGCWSA